MPLSCFHYVFFTRLLRELETSTCPVCSSSSSKRNAPANSGRRKSMTSAVSVPAESTASASAGELYCYCLCSCAQPSSAAFVKPAERGFLGVLQWLTSAYPTAAAAATSWTLQSTKVCMQSHQTCRIRLVLMTARA